MRNTVITAMLALVATAGLADNKIISQTDGSITFVVDANLTPTEKNYRFLYDGESLARSLLHNESISEEAYGIIATSFADAENMKYFGKDAFYRCVVEAYANHLSVALSPDMIWLLISQGFARYVNAHAEEVRPLLVSHSGTMDLAIVSETDLLSGSADWPKLVGGFAAQIDQYTKGDIAKTIAADFTTTGVAEHVASQITLMESVKSYFEYIVYYIACGIPSITLKGTPEDWQRVLDKTRQLRGYGLDGWVKRLEPVLKEFVCAAEGHPRQKFWQGMVKKRRISELKGGGCSPEKPTALDGWLLTFFPDENGKTLDRISHLKDMPSECVRVGFKYRVIDPMQGTVISETPLELWAGFIGAEVDTHHNRLIPKVGWLVRQTESDDDLLNRMKEMDENLGIDLRVKEVPEVLSRLSHIQSLSLQFTDEVVLPEWLDRITIDRFSITGKMTEAEKSAILKRFPEAKVYTTD